MTGASLSGNVRPANGCPNTDDGYVVVSWEGDNLIKIRQGSIRSSRKLARLCQLHWQFCTPYLAIAPAMLAIVARHSKQERYEGLPNTTGTG